MTQAKDREEFVKRYDLELAVKDFTTAVAPISTISTDIKEIKTSLVNTVSNRDLEKKLEEQDNKTDIKIATAVAPLNGFKDNIVKLIWIIVSALVANAGAVVFAIISIVNKG